MTTSEKKRYLQQYRKCELAQKQIEEEIERVRLSFLPSVKLSDMPHAHEMRDLSNYIVSTEDLFIKLWAAVDRKRELHEAIDASIERMSDEGEKAVLRYRYIMGCKWEEIAEKMHYSERRVHYLHGSALVHFEVKE